jgi:hypothetical protein
MLTSDMNLIVLMWQGTVAGVEIDMGHGRLYTTIVVPRDEAASYGARGSPGARVDDPGTYNPELFRLSLPQVTLSVLLPEHMPSFRSNRVKDFSNDLFQQIHSVKVLPLHTFLLAVRFLC